MNWSFQLYSARNTALADSLAIISKAGYTGVEAYHDNFVDSNSFKRLLDEHDLLVPSMHINIGPLRNEAQRCMQRARDFGSSHIVCPYLEPAERPIDSGGWVALIKELSDHARRWQDAGFTFAWHNHDFEFVALPDGAVPMQLIMENAPQLCWEIDPAWIVRSGTDPLPWIERHSSRISAVHLKDVALAGNCTDEDGWADLGYGIIPWATLMPKLRQSSAVHYAMEHDNPSDLNRFATRSIATANTLTDGVGA